MHMFSHGRQYPPSTRVNEVTELVVGTRGRSNCHDMSNVRVVGSDMAMGESSPYIQEHIDLVKSILGEGPYQNQAMSVAESTLTCIMGRESAYSGLEITWDMAMASKQDLQPKAFDYALKMDVPPVPVPGIYKFV